MVGQPTTVGWTEIPATGNATFTLRDYVTQQVIATVTSAQAGCTDPTSSVDCTYTWTPTQATTNDFIVVTDYATPASGSSGFFAVLNQGIHTLAPSITSVNPSSISNGTIVTVDGANFSQDMQVNFSQNGSIMASIPGTNFSSFSPSEITLAFPGTLAANMNSEQYDFSLVNANGNSNFMTANIVGSNPTSTLPQQPASNVPTCTVTSDRESYNFGDRMTLTWTSQNATWAFWVDNDATNFLSLAGGRLILNGTETESANKAGDFLVSLKVGDAQGHSSSCSVQLHVAGTGGQACTPSWSCQWGPCVNGYHSQSAVDANHCGSPSTNMCPALAQACAPTQPSPTQPTVKIPPAGFEDQVITNFNTYQNPFPDTDMSLLSGKAAAELYRRAVIGGFPDGTFRGNQPVNRAEAAKFLLLARFESVTEVSNNGQFPDVLDGQWYTKFVVTAANDGIINGYPDGTFKPADQVNTAEFLKMFSLTFGLQLNMSYSYSDVSASDWFAQYAGIALKYNLFPERTSKLNPDTSLTRQDVAVAIYQYLSNR